MKGHRGNEREMSHLLSTLKMRVQQLEHRKEMIPKYCDQKYNWSGKNHYSLDMIPDIENQIAETKAAIRGIKQWKRNERWTEPSKRN